MKHTLTVNLNGKLFNIDNDAYNLLDSYIKSLNSYFAKDSSRKEIIADFEGRIQELLSGRKPNVGDVISIDDVEEVIKQIGKPTEFEVDAEDTNDSSNETKGYAQNEAKRIKRLYRNPNDKMLGGVCSGVATFFNIDVSIIRIILVLLVLFSVGSLIIAYIVLWILLPEAKTAEEQLQMRGEPITIENIGKIVSENAQSVGNDVKDAFNRANQNGFISTIFKMFFIVIGAIVLIPLVFALLVLIAVLFKVVGAFFVQFSSAIALPSTISVGLFLGIPIVAMIYGILSSIFKWSPMHKSVKIISLAIWLVSLVILVFTATKINWQSVSEQEWVKALQHKSRKVFGWEVSSNTVVGYGNIQEKTYKFEQPIEAIDVRSNIEIEILEDKSITDQNTVVVVTDSNLLDVIQVNLYANILTINTPNNISIEPTHDNIILKVKQNIWKSIELSGATELTINDKWQMKDVYISVGGASNLYAGNVEFDRLNMNVNGASNVDMIGSAKYAEYHISGNSDIDNEQLLTDSITVKIAGASDLDIYPLKYLKGKASGASNITSHNRAGVLSVDNTGSSTFRIED